MVRRIGTGLRRRLLRVTIARTIVALAGVAAGVTLAGPVEPPSPLASPVYGGACSKDLHPIAAQAVHGRIGGESDYCFPRKEGRVGTRIDSLHSAVATRVLALAENYTNKVESREVVVICWGESDWDRLGDLFGRDGNVSNWFGYVRMPREVINLSPTVCANLDRIAHARERSISNDTARAVTVLAHEAMHAGGLRPEAIAECYAMQLAEFTAQQLGGDQAWSHELALYRVNTYEERYARTQYEMSGCEKDLLHDLGIPNSVLPDSFLSS